MGAKGSGRQKKIYKLSDYNLFMHLKHSDLKRDVKRNFVIAKYLCGDPYYRYALWQMIKTKGDYYYNYWREIDNGCEEDGYSKSGDIKDVPVLELILGTVVAWTYDEKRLLIAGRRNCKGKMIETCKRHIISWALMILLDAMRYTISKDVEKKDCKFYEFPEPEKVKLVKEAVN